MSGSDDSKLEETIDFCWASFSWMMREHILSSKRKVKVTNKLGHSSERNEFTRMWFIYYPRERPSCYFQENKSSSCESQGRKKVRKLAKIFAWEHRTAAKKPPQSPHK
ncbi:hypothetical protein HAX54_011223, partial [Datura stramonium]|nr:hypothetical protein [Datura stramonium]